jgi:HD-GYP domain-containing protein (c-di-GMP phosphodiesterase class II)/PAS domain-containing protein
MALILAVAFIYPFLLRWRRESPRLGSLLLGLAFGLAGTLAMALALKLGDGVIFDTRTVVISMGALFGGPLAGAVAAVIASAARYGLGGVGVDIGIGVIALAALAGALAGPFYRRLSAPRRWSFLAAFGLLLHLVCLGAFAALPLPFVDFTLRQLAPFYLPVAVAATVLLGLMLSRLERTEDVDRLLGLSRRRTERLFDSATVGLLDVDLSPLWRFLEERRADGVTDLEGYLASRPETVARLIRGVRIGRANPEAQALLGASGAALLGSDFEPFHTDASREAFRQSVLALWNREHSWRQETTLRTARGEDLRVVVSAALPDSEEAARHVALGLDDVTDLYRSRVALSEELARLAERRQAILDCHAAIFHGKTRNSLLDAFGRALAGSRGYPLVILQDLQAATGRPSHAFAGGSDAPLEALCWLDPATCAGPPADAMKTRGLVVSAELATNACPCAAMTRAREQGYRACLALPVLQEHEVDVLVIVFSRDADQFDSEEQALLQQLGNDLTLALSNRELGRQAYELGQQLGESTFHMIRALARTIEKRDPYTSGHQDNVARLAVAIGESLGWEEGKLQGLRLGATIHDVGKIHIPAEILNRPGRLSDAEYELIKSHPEVGADIIDDVAFPWPLRDMILQHHERMDGSGYPAGLAGEAICPEARVIAVADVVDAITSHRPYRPSRGTREAIEELKAGRGTRYDAAVVDACLNLLMDPSFRWAEPLAA